MSVEVIARLCHADQPVDGFQPLMGVRIVIMDPKRRGMCNQNIEGAAIVDSVQQEMRQQAKGSGIGFRLCILIGPVRTIVDRSAEAGDQEFFNAHQLQVQV